MLFALDLASYLIVFMVLIMKDLKAHGQYYVIHG